MVLGSRLSTLMMSLVPPLTAAIGWLALGETLAPRDLLGMTLTVGGIAWAVLERTKPRRRGRASRRCRARHARRASPSASAARWGRPAD